MMVHGFPDFWYSWRAQMPALAKTYHVVAIDQRGYNLSGQPEGVENYKTDKLVGDLLAVVNHFTHGKAIIVGHDWGGLVAWTFAMTHPERTDRLIVLNLPHPRGPAPRAANEPPAAEEQPVRPRLPEARRGQEDVARPAHVLGQGPGGPQGLRRGAQTVVDGRDAQLLQGQLPARSADAQARSEPQAAGDEVPPVKCPVLLIHGLKDQALLPGALNDTWNWIEGDLTLVTIPEPAISSSRMPRTW